MILKTLRYDIQDNIATITFDEQGSPVNTMCLQWQTDLAQVAERVKQDASHLKGLILASSKSTFFAGADLKGVMRSTTNDGPRVFAEIEGVKKSFRTLETCGFPVVSCLNGSALGGGLEVALVGHYRIATQNPKAIFGFPEITLGLIPGAGGITKMTRILGLVAAQPYILECKLFNAEEAHRLGLVHELVASDDLLRPQALAYIASVQGKPEASQHVWDRKDYKMPGGTPANPKIAGMLTVAPAMLKLKTRGLYPAPEAALAAMVEGAMVDFDTAMRIESRYLATMMNSEVARNMINTVFFNMNSYKADQAKLQAELGHKPESAWVLNKGMPAAGLDYAQWFKAEPTDGKQIYIKRLITAYVHQAEALLAEGVSEALIENLAVQTGMHLGPLKMKAQCGNVPHATVSNAVQTAMASLQGAPLHQTIQDRILFSQALEAAKCLQEGVLSAVHEANIGSVFVMGFPACKGGTLQMIYAMGVDAFAYQCQALANQFGSAFVLTAEVVACLKKHQPQY
jgi:3-hydroxyacyl-CoA dehydrogenase/enoyl-CoA hydratase/3-hydroxybutyryl-CoA epimerase